jgi:hypothetical protein
MRRTQECILEVGKIVIRSRHPRELESRPSGAAIRNSAVEVIRSYPLGHFCLRLYGELGLQNRGRGGSCKHPEEPPRY